MSITHVTQYCHIGSVGGTERYIADLIECLGSLGMRNEILWLTGSPASRGDDDGALPVAVVRSLQMRVDEPDERCRRELDAYVEQHDLDLLHFHTFGLTEYYLARLANAVRIPYVFTYHSPAWTCRRDDLLRWGTHVCDGQVRPLRCGACKVHERSAVPRAACWLGALVSAALGRFGRRLPRRISRRIDFYSDTQRFQQRLAEFLARAARSVACSHWGRDVLLRNGASPQSIVDCPQGVSPVFNGAPSARQSTESGRFVVGYIGRVSEIKGVHLLVEAFARTTCRNARLYIYGDVESVSVQPYSRRLRSLAGSDDRIVFKGRLPMDRVAEAYSELSLLAIPSVWLETGPLTLFEAKAMGVPVFGSRNIGQLDLLSEAGDVIEGNSVEEWTDALNAAFSKFETNRWPARGERRSVRTMEDVARQMHEVYRNVLGETADSQRKKLSAA